MARVSDKAIGWAFYIQLLANLVALGVVISLMFLVQNSIADQTINATRANRALIAEVAREIDTHARADADRSCASAKGLEYLIGLSPDLEPEVARKFHSYVEEACKFVAPGA